MNTLTTDVEVQVSLTKVKVTICYWNGTNGLEICYSKETAYKSRSKHLAFINSMFLILKYFWLINFFCHHISQKNSVTELSEWVVLCKAFDAKTIPSLDLRLGVDPLPPETGCNTVVMKWPFKSQGHMIREFCNDIL